MGVRYINDDAEHLVSPSPPDKIEPAALRHRGRRKEQWHMTDCYSLWVDLPNKLISPVEVSGFSKFAYESQEALERVIKLLFADGYRLRAA